MSLQLAAKHLAAHGRGPDTTLVHMTPGEVASLQSLAQQHGGSLTTNPHTGLPEAGFLSALLPMAAGAGLAAMGMPAGFAALSVGAASAMTNGGDLRKGLMNGISAYGGAGMAESFMGAGLGTMGGAMGAPAAGAAPTTVLETPAGATSPYALTGSTAAPSTAGYSLGESSSYVNQPLPTLASAAPAQVAQQAAAMTPAAQAAQQSAALNELSMGQRWDALKAGATGTNAMNYIKANPLTSLGIAAFAMTPDEKNVAQKAPDTDRGPRANMQYHPGWSTPTPRPNMFGVEQTYNRPYYAAEGGITHMATGGITSAPRNQQQLFADYLSRVSSSGAAGNTTPPNNYDWWKNPNDPTPTTASPTLPFLETPVVSNTQGSGNKGKPEDFNPEWTAKTDEQKAAWYAEHPNFAAVTQAGQNIFGYTGLGMLQNRMNPGFVERQKMIAEGINPNASFGFVQAPGERVNNPIETPLADSSTTFATAENPYSSQYGPDFSGGMGFGLAANQQDSLNRALQSTSTADTDSGYNPGPNAQAAQSALAKWHEIINRPLTLNAATPTTDTQNISEGTSAVATPVATPVMQEHSIPSSEPQGGEPQGGEPQGGDGDGGEGGGGGDARGGYLQHGRFDQRMARGGNVHGAMRPPPAFFQNGKYSFHPPQMYADGGELDPYNLGSYSDGGRLLKGPGDGVSDSIPATIGKGRPARLADGEFVVPARIVSEIGNGSTEAGARKLYAMMDRIQAGRKKSIGKGKVAVNSRADKYLPA
jgi:hypothetical protein